MSSAIKTISYGSKTTGVPFSKQLPYQLGLHTGAKVDQITINDVKYGNPGGGDRGTLTFATDEYVNEVVIRYSDAAVYYCSFKTNKDHTISGGGSTGKEANLSHIRLIAVGGRSGARVDQLVLMYVEGYKESKVVETNVGFIISYDAPNKEFHQYTNSLYKTIDSYERITSTMLNQTYSASIEAEYFVKASASIEIGIEDTSVNKLYRELETKIESGSDTTTKIPEDKVGVKLVTGTIMQGADKSYWMYPTSDISYSIIEQSAHANVSNHYDLTGQLSTQIPGLIDTKTKKYGWVYYP